MRGERRQGCPTAMAVCSLLWLMPPKDRHRCLSYMRILLIESNAAAAASLGDFLDAQGHSVDYAASVPLALHLAATGNFQAIVLAHRPTGLDGLSLCRLLRTVSGQSPTPPILLSGENASVAHTVAAFEAGADDYLARPLAIAEAYARLKALARRCQRHAGSILQLGDLTLNLGTQEAHRQGVRLRLRPIEFKLLQILMEAAPNVLSSRALEAGLWGANRSRVASNLWVQIYNLRRVVDQPFNIALIQTRYGLGYRMAVPEELSCEHGTELTPIPRTGY